MGRLPLATAFGDDPEAGVAAVWEARMDRGPDFNAASDRLQMMWRNTIVAVIVAGFVFAGALSLLFFAHDAEIVVLGYRHFAAIFGLPAAAAAALLVVLLTRAISGQMSIEFLGFKFHGAASEALMWVICFLAITYAIDKTWALEHVPAYLPDPVSRPTG